ncbi:type IV pilus assembly protein PilM [Alkalithermobacter paradoxus]|uniref:Competence protein A n=1 Tax=Alkalithermobacter paradoxus TaxID=29349 RepID=A0A1V4I8X3_9FIRM|nr:competence protein A [[Clostridium] thermoalcaliphilum]
MLNDILSIDIGSRNIKMVVGNKKPDKLIIKKASIIKTPNESFSDGNILDIKSISDVIKSEIVNQNIKVRKAICTFQSTSVISRELYLPIVSQKELQKMINFEIEQYLPIQLDEYVIEHKILQKLIQDNIYKYRIWICAVPKSIAKKYFELLNELNLDPIALDINSNAISKLYKESEYKSQTIAVIDMGYTFLNVKIISKGVSQFSRLINGGGRDIDSSISNILDINLSESEKKKTQYSIIDDNLLVHQAIIPCVENWVEDIKRVFKYYTSRDRENSIDTVFLHGGSSNISEISNYISTSLNIPTYTVDKIDGIITKVKNIDTKLYLNCIGALIRN